MSEPFAFSPLDPAVRREPWAIFARGRDEQPAYEHHGLPLRVISLFRHADVQATLRDDAAFSNSFPTPRLMREQLLGEDALPPPSMLGTDGELRSLKLNGVSLTPLLPLRIRKQQDYVDRITNIVRVANDQ